MKQLVKLWERPSFDGKKFRYYLLFTDDEGKRRQKSLGHANRQKAERERAQLERHLQMALSDACPMSLKQFVEVSLARTGDQIRESTQREYRAAMKDFTKVVGNMDYQQVSLKDGEFYRQRCLDRGNSRATVAKKLRHLKCIFHAGVKRRLLGENPLEYISMPRYSKNDIRRYSDKECEQLLKAAQDFTGNSKGKTAVRWDLLVVVALSTGLRRGELLNCTWKGIDFEEQTIRVAPKEETVETWEWLIKDTDRRTLPLTDELVRLLVDHQSRQPEGYPYVFVPPARYDYIQRRLRATGTWTYSDSRLKVVNNFGRDFGVILQRAGVENGEFHDLRRTAICNWFEEGMSEFDVMKFAGHADFRTTHRFYLRVRDDLVQRARRATERGLCQKLLQKCCNYPASHPPKKASTRKCLPQNDLPSGQDWS
jgi:integrase